MIFSETKLRSFAAPISDTEDQQCRNAINMIRNALKLKNYYDSDSDIMQFSGSSSYYIRMRDNAGNKIKIFIQGSYANKTNIRKESDVDIAVVRENHFHTNYREGITDAVYGFSSHPDNSKQFKDEIQSILINSFGANDVKRHNKSIHVKGNTYRKDSDVVPCTRYRDYSIDFDGDVSKYRGGIYIVADDGSIIINYPEQHIENGVKKNSNTSFRFKKMIRIAKNIRVCMENGGIASAKKMSSFLIESLLWNVPDYYYCKYDNYICFIFDEVISYLYEHIDDINTYKEINGIKNINNDSPSRIEDCITFINDLKRYFRYSFD